jgi:hypothetical protein
MNSTSSHLIEPGVKYFIGETLKNCRKTKVSYYNNLMNFSIFTGILLVVSGTLYYLSTLKRKKREIDPIEKHEYVMNLVRKMKENDNTKNMITNLPEYQSEFELTMKKFL